MGTMKDVENRCPVCAALLDPGGLNGLCMHCVARDFLQPTEFSVDETVDAFFVPDGDGPRLFGGFEVMEELGRDLLS